MLHEEGMCIKSRKLKSKKILKEVSPFSRRSYQELSLDAFKGKKGHSLFSLMVS